MNCEEAMKLESERLAAGLPEQDTGRLEAHLATCDDCRSEARAMAALWEQMRSLEQADAATPHERMRARLHAALAAYDHRRGSGGPLAWLRDGLPQSLPQGAFALLLLVVGLLAGHAGVRSTQHDIAALERELDSVALALLDHQSATERLRGVESVRRSDADPRVVGALLDTVRHDQSINVRLAALDALRDHLGSGRVVAGLTAALADQDAPVMQVSLAHVLVDSGAAASIDAVRRMAANDSIDPRVRRDLTDALRDRRAAPAAGRGI